MFVESESSKCGHVVHGGLHKKNYRLGTHREREKEREREEREGGRAGERESERERKREKEKSNVELVSVNRRRLKLLDVLHEIQIKDASTLKDECE